MKNVANNAKTTKKLGGVTGKGFMPGSSGNPTGRPKKKPITEMFEKMLEDAETHDSIANAMLKIFSERSGIAKVMLLKDMAERVEGKVTQPIDAELTISTLSERMRRAKERLQE